MGDPNNQDFWPRINIRQWNCCILWINIMPGPQNVPKLYLQSQLSTAKNQQTFSLSFFFFKNTYQFRRPFFSTPILDIFSNRLDSGKTKSLNYPKLKLLSFVQRTKFIFKVQQFPLIMLTFGQKSCLLGQKSII